MSNGRIALKTSAGVTSAAGGIAPRERPAGRGPDDRPGIRAGEYGDEAGFGANCTHRVKFANPAFASGSPGGGGAVTIQTSFSRDETGTS